MTWYDTPYASIQLHGGASPDTGKLIPEGRWLKCCRGHLTFSDRVDVCGFWVNNSQGACGTYTPAPIPYPDELQPVLTSAYMIGGPEAVVAALKGD